ncbi:MAG TPA: hypothetical protein VLS52_08225 [Rudaea sp.]|nr:hypothetical protein [Rudaea sp.]
MSEVPVRASPRTAVPEAPTTSRRAGIASKEVGYYLDALQGRLMQEMPKDVGVVRQGHRIAVEIPNAEDATRFAETLQSVAKVLVEYHSVRVTLRSAPSAGETQTIAESRAHDAAHTLTRHGVAAGRIDVADGIPPIAAAHVELLLEPIVRSDN